MQIAEGREGFALGLTVRGWHEAEKLKFAGAKKEQPVVPLTGSHESKHRILAVHGIGQQRKGPNSLRKDWLPAMLDGMELAGAKVSENELVDFAFYGDPFRPKGHLAVGDPPYDASDVESWEGELLEALWREASRTDEAIVGLDDQTTMAHVPRVVQRALYALTNSKFFAGIAERALIFDLKHVRTYFDDAAVRENVQQRVSEQVSENTRVLIGHSLGSVVTYEALCAHPEWPINALITLGSRLGIPNLIFDRLRPSSENGLGPWPRNVKTWTNVVDRGDVVALEKDLCKCFGEDVENLVVDNGATAHNVEPYLTAKETGQAIAQALDLSSQTQPTR